MKRTLIPVAILAATCWAGIADAHTPVVTPSCTGLAINLTQYEGQPPNNRVSIQVDNHSLIVSFGPSYSTTIAWSQTVPHTWDVQIDANRLSGNPTQYDREFGGTWLPCQPTVTTIPPPTTDDIVIVTTTTVAPTTTAAVPTTPAPTTTVLVADGPPPVPPTTTASVPVVASPRVIVAPTVVLPRTGTTGVVGTLVIALVIAAAGTLALFAARRRSPR